LQNADLSFGNDQAQASCQLLFANCLPTPRLTIIRAFRVNSRLLLL
jgi:hypothetical protein